MGGGEDNKTAGLVWEGFVCGVCRGRVPPSNHIYNDFTGDMDVDLNLTITNCNQTIERYSKEETLK